MLKTANPLLYQQVSSKRFFMISGQFVKQARLIYYLKQKGYAGHHNTKFVAKCSKVRELFILNMQLSGIVMLLAFVIFAYYH